MPVGEYCCFWPLDMVLVHGMYPHFTYRKKQQKNMKTHKDFEKVRTNSYFCEVLGSEKSHTKISQKKKIG